MFVFITDFLRPSENNLQFFAPDLKYGLFMPIVNLSVPLYVHPIHFLPLLKWAAYVQSAPTIALLELQLQCPFHLVSWSLADMFAMLFAYFIYYSHAFCLYFLCVLCNKKKVFLINVQMIPICIPQTSFLILKQCLHYSFSIKPCYV